MVPAPIGAFLMNTRDDYLVRTVIGESVRDQFAGPLFGPNSFVDASLLMK